MPEKVNNPKLDVKRLESLKKSIKDNTATKSDYEYISDLLELYDIKDFYKEIFSDENLNIEGLIKERKKEMSKRKINNEGFIIGGILGAIEALINSNNKGGAI